MKLSHTFDLRPGAPVALWVEGGEHEAVMLEISTSHAQVRMKDGPALAAGQLVALRLRQHLSLPMRVTAAAPNHYELEFQSAPDPSVLIMVIGMMLEASFGAALSDRSPGSTKNSNDRMLVST